jgi:hypothetical protein
MIGYRIIDADLLPPVVRMHAESIVGLRVQTLFSVGDVEIRCYACAHGERSFVCCKPGHAHWHAR